MKKQKHLIELETTEVEHCLLLKTYYCKVLMYLFCVLALQGNISCAASDLDRG